MKLFDWVDRIFVTVGVLALIAMMLLTTVSVIGRYLFNAPIPDDLVMNEFLMVAVVFLPLSAVQAAREHVFVTIFSEWMSNEKKVMLETVGVVVGFVVFTVMAFATFDDFYAAYEVGAYVEGPLELPESPARFVVFLGLAVFAVRLFLDAILSILALIRGEAVATRSEEDRALDAEL